MNSNELTFNELSAGDFIPNDWGNIDLSSYVYADDEEVCFKLAVWSLQCKYANCVKKYFNSLHYGIGTEEMLKKLKVFKNALEVLNGYNPRDIENNTLDYNTIPYSTILDILQVLYKKY